MSRLSNGAFLGRLVVFLLPEQYSKDCYAQTVSSNRDKGTCLVLTALFVLFHQERKMAGLASLNMSEGVCGGKKGFQ